MTWTVLEKIALPVHEERVVWEDIVRPVATGESIIKEPGDKITVAEMNTARQTENDIQSLIDSGALEED